MRIPLKGTCLFLELEIWSIRGIWHLGYSPPSALKVEGPHGKEYKQPLGEENGPTWQQRRKWGPQSYNPEALNSTNNLVILEEGTVSHTSVHPDNTFVRFHLSEIQKDNPVNPAWPHDLLNCELMNWCCFKLLCLWQLLCGNRKLIHLLTYF